MKPKHERLGVDLSECNVSTRPKSFVIQTSNCLILPRAHQMLEVVNNTDGKIKKYLITFIVLAPYRNIFLK